MTRASQKCGATTLARPCPLARARLVAAVEAHVRPALRSWLEALEDYRLHARAVDGIGPARLDHEPH